MKISALYLKSSRKFLRKSNDLNVNEISKHALLTGTARLKIDINLIQNM